MKKYVCIILMLMLMMSVTAPTNAANEDERRLSELSAEECIEFIKSHGVEIPDKFEDEMTWAPFVHDIIVQVEANPNTFFSFNYSVLHFFANDIKCAVNEYYGVSETPIQSRVMIGAPLENNVPYGTWNSEYEGYNCYAYAIGEDEWIDPGVFDWVDKGNDSGTYNYNDQANIFTIAGLVEDDLIALGYTVSVVSTTMPSTVVHEHVNLICVRKDTDGYYRQYGNYFFYYYDYHFMKLRENGNWLHKPGGTNPLQYLYTPGNERIWVGEWSDNTGTFRDADLTYESEIYFIEYTTPHTYEYRMHGYEQHIQTCTICGETTGFAAPCVYVNNICRVCGRIKITGGGIITSVNIEDGE